MSPLAVVDLLRVLAVATVAILSKLTSLNFE